MISAKFENIIVNLISRHLAELKEVPLRFNVNSDNISFTLEGGYSFSLSLDSGKFVIDSTFVDNYFLSKKTLDNQVEGHITSFFRDVAIKRETVKIIDTILRPINSNLDNQEKISVQEQQKFMPRIEQIKNYALAHAETQDIKSLIRSKFQDLEEKMTKSNNKSSLQNWLIATLFFAFAERDKIVLAYNYVVDNAGVIPEFISSFLND